MIINFFLFNFFKIIVKSSAIYLITKNTMNRHKLLKKLNFYMTFLLKIIIILSALSLDFRTNLTGCYTSSSYVSFNKNLLTMTLHLTQTNNSSCSALSKETAANLTLASDNTPNIMRAQMLNFDYHSTNSIIF